eukprot:CAMPEP_0206308288 /NCGR_PEP_ID=MMETSP0106_2-20121207/11781_1 /ASSEMBLY_ACC=CAM_ASM_000206 /TAXON_ID=81532 /ORGANISM="Acanthoeca-like sp., Strain 10tr" /LENGTH=323 /DNA_ID=CAMNT_0053739321 /DNA_START=69 /DNA_END=1037 /DNA_ORIENTATION=-
MFAAVMALAAAAGRSSPCASTDHPADCAGLSSFGTALGWRSWVKSDNWLSDQSVCQWHGVTCGDGRVTQISLEHNGLKGALPEAIGNLTKLSILNLNGGRPASYQGCVGNNFHNSSIPDSLYTLTSLTSVNLEYTCLGGGLSPQIGRLTAMESFSVHGNYLSGSIPPEMNLMTGLTTFKLGRNPFTGGFPDMRNLTKLVQFNCNFCSLTGPVLDIFDNFPNLEFSYWDGNGFTGGLPKSVGKLKKLSRISFNINSLSGPVPTEWVGLAKSGVLTDCRIGADTNLTAYLANYPWIQSVTGNVYSCPLPDFAVGKGVCNHVTDCA